MFTINTTENNILGTYKNLNITSVLEYCKKQRKNQ